MTPSVTVAWQVYSPQLRQTWRGQRQSWRLFFQCRVDESAVEKSTDSTVLSAARREVGAVALNPDDPDSVDPSIPRAELEWITTDPSRVHVHGLILMPFPYKYGPWHTMAGSLVTMPQISMTVKVRLSMPVSLECTEAVLQGAIAEESKRVHCGTVHVVAMMTPPAEPVTSRFKPFAWLNFHSDLAAAVFASQAGAPAEGGRRSLLVAGVQVSWSTPSGSAGSKEGGGAATTDPA